MKIAFEVLNFNIFDLIKGSNLILLSQLDEIIKF